MVKITFLLISLTLFSSCIDLPDEVLVPTWDSELNLPIKTGQYFIKDVIDSLNNSNILLRDSLYHGSDYYNDSVYFLAIQDLSSTVKITDSIKIPFSISSDTLYLYGNTGGGIISNGIIYNPDPEYHLLEAEFRRGLFKLKLTNVSPANGFYEIIIPGFKRKSDNQIMSASGTINAGNSVDIEFNLGDYKYKELPLRGFNDFENFTSQASPGFLFVGRISSPNPVLLNISVAISNNELVISRLVGKIKKIVLPYEEVEFSTGLGDDVKDFRNNIKFEDIKIRVDVKTIGDLNNIKIVSDSLTFLGYQKTTGGVAYDSLRINFNNNGYLRTELIAGQPLTLTFDKNNTNLQELFTILPRYIMMGNRIVLDKSNLAISEQTVSDDAKIQYSGRLSVPLVFALKYLSYADTINLFKNGNNDGYLSEDDKNILKRAKAARLIFDVENFSGLGFVSSVKFLDKQKNILFNLRTSDNNNRILIPPATVDQSGKPLIPGKTQNLFIELSGDEIITLVEKAHFVLVDVAFYSYNSNPTNFGPTVRLRAKDYLKYKLSGMVKFQINSGETK